jgi:hypothetical protein
MYTQDTDRSRAAGAADERADRRMAAGPAHEFARRIDCADRERRGGERGGRGYGIAHRGGARRPD